jgi:hypothetical protein
MINDNTTCTDYAKSYDDEMNCNVDVLFEFTIVNIGNGCTTITDINLREDSIFSKDIFIDQEGRLCPQDTITVSTTRLINICSYFGRDVQFEFIINSDNSEVFTTDTTLQFPDIDPPIYSPSLAPSSFLPTFSPSSSRMSSKGSKNKCYFESSRLTFIYKPSLCKKDLSRSNKNKGSRHLKRNGKGSVKTERSFRCEDYDLGLGDRVRVVVFLGSSEESLLEVEVSDGEDFVIHLQKGHSLESEMKVHIYNEDGHLVQVLSIHICSTRNRLNIDDTFGSLELISFGNHQESRVIP